MMMVNITTDKKAIETLQEQISSLGLNIKDKHTLVKTVADISLQVAQNGDAALKAYTAQFDGVDIANAELKTTREDISEAYEQLDSALVTALKEAHSNIEAFHRHQLPRDWEKGDVDRCYGMQYKALSSVGLYVPGGRAVYPSSVLMNAVPAKLAGVKNCLMVSPPQKNGKLPASVLVAADIAGVDAIYKVGGAQAIFALAYGTESIPKVDKIVGPGNRFVTQAKQQVYGRVAIDKPAGPSEVLVYIDEARYADFAASEIWAQLEHDECASAIAVSPNRAALEAIQTALETQKKGLNRQAILEKSQANMVLLQVENEAAGIAVINEVASEHVVLLIDHADIVRPQIQHAGAIFCGPYTPVALGDYYAGPNHVLPTERAARYASALSVMDFMTFSSWLRYSKKALHVAEKSLKILTEAEGFDAHYQSVQVRV